MTSMIETVAGAIAQSVEARLSNDPDKRDWTAESWAHAAARAAIEAMREPTRQMLDAAYDASSIVPEDSWPAMIDAALKEER